MTALEDPRWEGFQQRWAAPSSAHVAGLRDTAIDLFHLGDMFEETVTRLKAIQDKLLALHGYMNLGIAIGQDPTYRALRHRTPALHRAIYQVSHIVITELVRTHYKLQGKAELTALVAKAQNYTWLLTWPPDLLLRAYCLGTYRNKIVSHHDEERQTGSDSGGRGGRDHTLLTYCVIPPDDETTLLELAGRWSGGCRHRLFYQIPVLDGATKGKDRVLIDGIAARCGVESRTVDEVLLTVLDLHQFLT